MGGKNSENFSTRMPTHLATVKWPSSCRITSSAKPAKARNQLTPATPWAASPARSRASASTANRSEKWPTGAPASRRACARSPRRWPANGSRPSRNAATATSLAAFSTHGAVPPAIARLARQAQAGEGVLVGRLEVEAAHARPGRASPPARRRGRGGAARRRSARACRGSPRCASDGAVVEVDQRVHDRLRVHHHVDPVVARPRTGGGPRSPRAPCSSAWPSRS